MTRDNEQLTLPADREKEPGTSGRAQSRDAVPTRPAEASAKPRVSPPAGDEQNPVGREMATAYAQLRTFHERERALYRAALDAEGHGDWAEAVRKYEEILRTLPEGVWHTDIPDRLAADKAILAR